MNRRTIAAFVLVFGMGCSWADAWSTKEHILLTRLAAERLIADPATPAQMRQWLERGLGSPRTLKDEREFVLHARVGAQPRGAEGLAFWAVMPDLEAALAGSGDRERRVEPFGVAERLLHFTDLEFFNADTAKRGYFDDLSGKPAVVDFPRDMHDPRWARAGMLPFRVEQCYGELVRELKAGRLNDKPGQFPRDEHAEKWAGMLAHYLEDNTQPQHSTIDYKSSHYFKDKLAAPNVHSDVEYKLIDDEYNDYPELRAEFWTLLENALKTHPGPKTSNDPWVATIEISLYSYDGLPMIGRAAAHAYGEGPNAGNAQDRGRRARLDAPEFFHFTGDFHGHHISVLELKAHQNALAVQRVAEMWRRAWRDAKGE